MKWVRRIAISVGALVLLGVVLVGGFALWIGSSAIDAPVVTTNDPSETLVIDEAFLPAIEAARERLVAYRTEFQAPSVSIAVAVDGAPVWYEVQGYAGAESLTPATLTSRYAIGSVSKTLTAALAVQLAEEGILDLDADIHDYVPDYPELPYPLTTRQLLSHQGGIRHYALMFNPPMFTESGMNRQFDTTAEALTIFSGDPLLFEPDTGFSYSTYGYTLVSAVIEGATGETFLDLLEARIFTPFAMHDTMADYSDRPVPNRVADYLTLQFLDGLLPAPEVNSSYKWAGGGIVSTAADLANFGSAMLLGMAVSPEAREEMWTPRTTADGEINPQYYGLGWRIGGLYYPRGSENVITMINHGGTAVGGTSILLIQPESGVVVAMTANITPAGGSAPLRSGAANVARDFLDDMGWTP